MISMTLPQYRRNECSIDGRVLRLKGQEAETLAVLLVSGPVRFISKNELIEAVWPNPDFEPDCAANMVEIFVCHLRGKGVPIETNWGIGWRIPEHARAYIGYEKVNEFAAEHSGNTQEERLAA